METNSPEHLEFIRLSKEWVAHYNQGKASTCNEEKAACKKRIHEINALQQEMLAKK